MVKVGFKWIILPGIVECYTNSPQIWCKSLATLVDCLFPYSICCDICNRNRIVRWLTFSHCLVHVWHSHSVIHSIVNFYYNKNINRPLSKSNCKWIREIIDFRSLNRCSSLINTLITTEIAEKGTHIEILIQKLAENQNVNKSGWLT